MCNVFIFGYERCWLLKKPQMEETDLHEMWQCVCIDVWYHYLSCDPMCKNKKIDMK